MEPFAFYPKLAFELGKLQLRILRVSGGPIFAPIPPHRHGADHFEIHFCVAGFGWVETASQRILVEAGSLYITGPGITHSQFSDPQQPMEEYCLNLLITSETPPLSCALEPLANYQTKDLGNLESHFATVVTELWEKPPFFEEAVIAEIQQLLIRLLRASGSETVLKTALATNETSFDTSWERDLMIDQYFLAGTGEASLADLANQLHLSSRQTQRLIRDLYDQTFQSKLTEGRMAAAKMLLRETHEAISLIADKLGYASLEHFSHSFKKQCQVAPSDYRKAHQQD